MADHEGAVPLRRGDYPYYLCADCGHASGKSPDPDGQYTANRLPCDVCGEVRTVLTARNYGHFNDAQVERMRIAAQQRRGGG
jgi:hypothetical protein